MPKGWWWGESSALCPQSGRDITGSINNPEQMELKYFSLFLFLLLLFPAAHQCWHWTKRGKVLTVPSLAPEWPTGDKPAKARLSLWGINSPGIRGRIGISQFLCWEVAAPPAELRGGSSPSPGLALGDTEILNVPAQDEEKRNPAHNYRKLQQKESLNGESHQHWLKCLAAVVLHPWGLTYFNFNIFLTYF